MIHRELLVYGGGASHAASSQPAKKQAQLQKVLPLDCRTQNDALLEAWLAVSAAEATKTNFPAHDCDTSSSPPMLTAV